MGFSKLCDSPNMDENPCCNDKIPDIPNIIVATINDQKNWDFPNPNWCKSLAGLLLNLIPNNNKIWFAVSDAEWNDSAHIEALPVIIAAMNLVTAIPKLPKSAA